MLKKLRAVVGNAVTWAAVWAGWGVALAWVLGLFAQPGAPGAWDFLPQIAAQGALMGFVGGTAFSAILGVLHRRYALAELDARRLALWGTLGGLVLPFGVLAFTLQGFGVPITPVLAAQTFLLFGVPGVASAFGTIKVAQAADRRLDGGGGGAVELPTPES